MKKILFAIMQVVAAIFVSCLGLIGFAAVKTVGLFFLLGGICAGTMIVTYKF